MKLGKRANFCIGAALLLGCSGISQDSESETLRVTQQALTDCSSVPVWAVGTYSGGDLVQNDGALYECKPYPFEGWCGQAAYEPGRSAYWRDAWDKIDDCEGDGGGAPEPPTCDLAGCCPEGSTQLVLTEGDDTTSTTANGLCIVALGGWDTIAAYGNDSTVLLGDGDDTVMAGERAIIRAGGGNDTINGFTNGIVLGNAGNDTINAANGDSFVVPGPGADNVTTGTGNDTVVIYNVCEIEPGEKLDGGSGTDTLITPVPVEQLELLGAEIVNFENIVIQSGSCQSECADVPDCSGRGRCVNDETPGEMSCDCDELFSGENCEFAFVVAQAGGVEYIEQCQENGVPIPPVWNYEDAFHGTNGTQWVNAGVLQVPFISKSIVAEVFYYESTDPVGVCIALPRSVMDANLIPMPNGIHLLGVICQGTVSSKACFWDGKVVDRFESMNFTDDCSIVGGFPNQQFGDIVGPTRYHTAAGASCFIGGTDLALPGASGGICTNCHRGENVFIMHPESALGLNIPNRMPNVWHDPIAPASWPQNPGPAVFGDADACLTCHSEAARGSSLFGGRFPEVSSNADSLDYCAAILKQSFGLTMPPGVANPQPGNFSTYLTLLGQCGLAP